VGSLHMLEPAIEEPSVVSAQATHRPILAAAALTGLGGEVVRTIEPYTEADPVAVLVQLLAAFGNLVGPGPHFRVEHTQHPPRLFVVLVGESSKARKGQSWSTPKHMLSQVDEAWTMRIKSGLSSGEGLIYAVRDENAMEGDPGEPDKRLFVMEEEFAQALKVMQRHGNILSVVIRDAWDHGNLGALTKNNAVHSTGAHVAVVGHITTAELLRMLTATEQANGFANRFLWTVVHRSKVIASPKGVPPELLDPLVTRLKEAAAAARSRGELGRDRDAEELWERVYPELSEGTPGLFGAVLNRGEAQVMRLALLYALLDTSPAIRPDHLKAGLAVWEYAQTSVRQIFGTKLGDPTADRILSALRDRGEVDETGLHRLFQNNISDAEMNRATDLLFRHRLAEAEVVRTGGRPKVVWRPTN
jgi:hypothetical protein